MATLTNNGKMIKDVKFSLKNPKYFNCILFILLHFINGIEPILIKGILLECPTPQKKTNMRNKY